jgi:hypothetical protein
LGSPVFRSAKALVALCTLTWLTAVPISAGDFTATSINNGLWQNSANWVVTPGGSVNGYPNNVGIDVFDVSIPSLVTFDLNANGTIRDLNISNGVNLQNASDRTLRIEGNLTAVGGIGVFSAAQIQLLGTSNISSGVQLLNGSSALNLGTLNVIGVGGGGSEFEVIGAPGAVGYTFRNAGTTVINRLGATNLFVNQIIQNVGTFEFLVGSTQLVNIYTQTAGTTIIHNGSTFAGNNFSFNGGSVFGSGPAFNTSSFNMNGARLEIGVTAGAADSLTLAGNIASPVNSIFDFDLGGLGQGTTYDHLIIPNGTDLNGVTADVLLFGGFIPGITDTFTIMTGNNYHGAFANDVGGKIFAPGYGAFTVTYSTTSVVLGGFTPIPEPSALISTGAGLAWLLYGRRRV